MGQLIIRRGFEPRMGPMRPCMAWPIMSPKHQGHSNFVKTWRTVAAQAPFQRVGRLDRITRPAEPSIIRYRASYINLSIRAPYIRFRAKQPRRSLSYNSSLALMYHFKVLILKCIIVSVNPTSILILFEVIIGLNEAITLINWVWVRPKRRLATRM